ncbi:hypothetical protein H5410_059170 [Solanum commersonii]|uniref:Uncharacterized protein n=1 Tax=Solanum commersonii TaxID=4109 RepID=A0A9J5W260_SOLCO|nr:hypothetical protein H5410_059170 [Solanum commersonii]
MDICYDLINGINLSRGKNGRIFKFERDPKLEKPIFYRFSYAIVHEFLVVGFQKNSWTSITTLLMVLVVHGFLVIHESRTFYAYFYHGRPLRPYKWRQLITRGKQMHFQV